MNEQESRPLTVAFEAGRAGRGGGLAAPFACAWNNRHLLRRLVQRDIEARFRGTVLGKVWVVAGPLVMLALYTFVFGVVIRPQWQEGIQNRLEIPLIYFSGLLLFDFFIECLVRAPNLMRENTVYIKKVIFPVEILAWMVVGTAAFRLLISILLLLVFHLLVNGMPPATVLLVPLFLLPFCVVLLGLVWLLASLAVYLRDIVHVVTVIAPIIMFLSPIFYPVSAVPEQLRAGFYANPLTFVIENVRAALFAGTWQNWAGLVAYTVAALAFAWLAHRLFMKLRPGFADVL